MKYVFFGYVALMALLLTFKPAAVSKGPQCGPGVLCIRERRQVLAVLDDAPNPKPSAKIRTPLLTEQHR